MKKFYSAAMLAALAMSSVTAIAAKPDWEHQGSWQLFEQSNQFRPVYATQPMVADFNNTDRYDVYYGGGNEYYDDFNKPGCWPWPFLSMMYLDNGDGTYKCLWNGPEYVETRQEEVKDGDGNPVLDEDGNPVYEDKDYYRQSFPENGIIPGMRQSYAVFDYDNDGLLDMYIVMVVNSNDYAASYRDQLYFEQVGDKNCYITCQLYHNNGNGTFTRIEEHGLPAVVRPDANADEAERLYNSVFAVGDYDRDGYVDLAVCGKRTNRVSGEAYRVAQLYRNINGTGKFQQVLIAETKGGAYGEAQLGEDEFEMPGAFMPVSGNVKFADLDNDGWLDLFFSGYAPASSVHDPNHPEGVNNVSRIYLNKDDGNGGRKFVDVTDASKFVAGRSCGIDLSPNPDSGYLDLYTGGYVDGLGGWIFRVYFNNGDEESGIYNEDAYASLQLQDFEPAWKEDFRPWIRDFNGDGYVDIYLDGVENNNTYYGNAAGTFEKECDYLRIRDFAKDTGACPADFNGSGRADLFLTGSCYQEGTEYQYMRNTDSGGGWASAAFMYENQHENEPADVEAPTDVHAVIEDGMLTVTWVDNDDLTCAYNVYIETPDRGKVSLVAANPVTGFLRNTTDRHVAVRPGVQTYSIPATAEKGYKVGVQAISLFNEKYSPFTWSAEDLSASVDAIAVDNTNVQISVNGDAVVVNADANADVQIVDMLGRTVATGVTNAAINVAAKGVLVATVNGKAVKFVK
ncbi:MAG: VCBS repeat-containing protein [Paramuribaculum sp.]|nr:VCBS repeat-containing protein [Paramuribaculum sp.]